MNAFNPALSAQAWMFSISAPVDELCHSEISFTIHPDELVSFASRPRPRVSQDSIAAHIGNGAILTISIQKEGPRSVVTIQASPRSSSVFEPPIPVVNTCEQPSALTNLPTIPSAESYAPFPPGLDSSSIIPLEAGHTQAAASSSALFGSGGLPTPSSSTNGHDILSSYFDSILPRFPVTKLDTNLAVPFPLTNDRDNSPDESSGPTEASSMMSFSRDGSIFSSQPGGGLDSDAFPDLLNVDEPDHAQSPDGDEIPQSPPINNSTARKAKRKSRYHCAMNCGATFSRRHDKLRHEVVRHSKRCEWSCQRCLRHYSSEKSFLKHSKTCTGNVLVK